MHLPRQQFQVAINLMQQIRIMAFVIAKLARQRTEQSYYGSHCIATWNSYIVLVKLHMSIYSALYGSLLIMFTCMFIIRDYLSVLHFFALIRNCTSQLSMLYTSPTSPTRPSAVGAPAQRICSDPPWLSGCLHNNTHSQSSSSPPPPPSPPSYHHQKPRSVIQY